MSTVTANYGVCLNCHIDLPTQDDARDHMAATRPEGLGSSHRVRILNPPPEDRARSAVARVIEDAINRAFEDIDRLIDRGEHTEEHITKALRGYPDFADAWDEWRDEQ